MAHEGGRNAPVSHLLLCVGLFLDTAENVRQCVRCRRIAGADEPGVNIRGGAGLCVAQTARNRCDRHVGRYQQAGVGVPLRYNYDKPEKPRISRVFGYLARFFILFQTEKSSREVVIS